MWSPRTAAKPLRETWKVSWFWVATFKCDEVRTFGKNFFSYVNLGFSMFRIFSLGKMSPDKTFPFFWGFRPFFREYRKYSNPKNWVLLEDQKNMARDNCFFKKENLGSRCGGKYISEIKIGFG